MNLTTEKYQEIKTTLESENISEFPPLFQQARNLIKQFWLSGIEAAKGKPLVASVEKAAARLSICETCEFFTEGRCKKCGCFMRAKVHVDSSSCPLNKWYPNFQDRQISLTEYSPPLSGSTSPLIKEHSKMMEFTALVLKHKEPDQPKNFTFMGVNYYVEVTDGVPMVHEVRQ